jgi:hypothetical protein
MLGGSTRNTKTSNELETMVETELDVLRDVSKRLESAGISFMVTGSVAMNYYAQQRCLKSLVSARLDSLCELCVSL